MGSRKLWIGAAIAAIALGFGAYAYSHPMDFRVYYVGARGVYDGTRPVYGVKSGIGWPMHYRYPPLFLLLFAPFSVLPLGWSAAIWTALKVAALAFLARTLWIRAGPASDLQSWWIPLLLAGPYVVEDLRYGNAQSYVFALTAAALLLTRSSKWIAGAVLGLAIILKVWPLFFVPYAAARREWKFAGLTLAFAGLFALVPSFYFGIGGNADLIRQWAVQESSTQTGENEAWFPSQSLRGAMMRYLTAVDYSTVPDSNYPPVHVAALPPLTVRNAWLVLAAIGYGGLLLTAWRLGAHKAEPPNDLWLDALALALVPLLEPFTQKYALVVLLFPAIVAGRMARTSTGWTRWLLYSAVALAAVQPVIPGAPEQRMMQALGVDFVAAALLAAFIWLGRPQREFRGEYVRSRLESTSGPG